MEEDQLTVTLRMLAEGQSMLTDILSQLDKLPAERNVKVNVVSDTGAGGISGASDQVQEDVADMNKSMMTMPAGNRRRARNRRQVGHGRRIQ